MSDETNSGAATGDINTGMSEIADQVDTAVAGSSEDGQQAAGDTQTAAADAKATLQDPNASKAEKKEAAKTIKKLMLKIDGREVEETLPFEIPNDPKSLEWMRKELQMGRMGQKRAQEKATIEKEVLQFIEDLKKNPKKALSDPAIGMDLKKFAASIIEEEIENSKKSPEQLKYEKAQEELKSMKEEREREKKDADARELARLTDKYAEDYENQITTALASNKIPKSPAAVKKIVDYMTLATDAGKDVSVNDIIPLIREELNSDFLEHLNSLPDEELDQYIPKAIQDRLRKKNIAKAKQANSNPALKAATKVPSTGKTGEKKAAEPKMSFKKFFEGI